MLNNKKVNKLVIKALIANFVQVYKKIAIIVFSVMQKFIKIIKF